MTPPGSVLISAFIHRALAYEAKGDYEHAKQDFGATLEGVASDAGSKANQTTAKVRQSLLSDPVTPSPPRARRQARRRRRSPRRHRQRARARLPAPASRW
jgi:hypothetical protein